MSRQDLIISNRRPWLALLAILAWCTSVSALALEANQVRGEIVDVNAAENRLTVDVQEAGPDMAAREGATETYEFDEDTQIRMEEPGESVLDPLNMTIDDLEEGNVVVLDFEDIEGRLVARNVSIEPADSTVADTESAMDDEESASELAALESERDELPATASALPLLAMLGAGFAGIALLLRIRRR